MFTFAYATILYFAASRSLSASLSPPAPPLRPPSILTFTPLSSRGPKNITIFKITEQVVSKAACVIHTFTSSVSENESVSHHQDTQNCFCLSLRKKKSLIFWKLKFCSAPKKQNNNTKRKNAIAALMLIFISAAITISCSFASVFNWGFFKLHPGKHPH